MRLRSKLVTADNTLGLVVGNFTCGHERCNSIRTLSDLPGYVVAEVTLQAWQASQFLVSEKML